MKKYILIFVSFVLFAVSAFSAETSFKFKRSRDGKGLCIDKYTGDEKYVVIEPYYDGLPVREINYFAFSECDVVMVWLPSTLVDIGEHAFYRCNNLVQVTLPQYLNTIGDSAFAYCQNLSAIQIDRRLPLQYFSNSAFSHCDSLPMNIQLELIQLGYKGQF